MAELDRTRANPWLLRTLPGTAECTMRVAQEDGVQVPVRTVGKTVLPYDARRVEDLHAMLKAAAGWLELGERTSRSRRRTGRWKPGGAPRTTPSVAGTG